MYAKTSSIILQSNIYYGIQKNNAEEHLRLFFEIIKRVKSEPKLVTYALLLIDGILEDNRSRIQYLVNIQRSHKKEKREDLVNVLISFLYQNNQPDNDQRDLASHILSMLIEAHEYRNCAEESKSFLNWIWDQRPVFDVKRKGESKTRLSTSAYTFALMYLLKTNELAQEFVRYGGFELFANYLEEHCLSDHQIAYNVVCALWIVSYHPFAIAEFENDKVS